MYIGISDFACFLLNSCSLSKLKGHREHANFGLLREEGGEGKQEEQGHPLYILTPDRPPRAAAYYGTPGFRGESLGHIIQQPKN